MIWCCGTRDSNVKLTRFGLQISNATCTENILETYSLGYRSVVDGNYIWLSFPLIFANRKQNLQKLENSLEITREFL